MFFRVEARAAEMGECVEGHRSKLPVGGIPRKVVMEHIGEAEGGTRYFDNKAIVVP
jgi:hypothetical protein